MNLGNWIELGHLAFEGGTALAALVVFVWGLQHRAILREVVTKKDLASYRESHDKVHDDLGDRLSQGDQRFVRLETILASLPTHKDLSDIREGIAGLNAEVRGVRDSIAGLNGNLDRLLDHQINGG